MKSLLCLAAICITLSVCSGFCFSTGVTVIVTEDGKTVIPEDCVDVFDGIRHLIGSTWNSSYCMRCSCSTGGTQCCSREMVGHFCHMRNICIQFKVPEADLWMESRCICRYPFRYSDIVAVPGCKAILDQETCEFKLYKLDDPTQPC